MPKRPVVLTAVALLLIGTRADAQCDGLPNGTPCDPRPTLCAVGDCQNNVCVPRLGTCPGGLACCDDGNPCTDECQDPDGCIISSVASGSVCNDGAFCNGADSCDGRGACALHSGDPCPGADADGDCSESCSEEADSCEAADPDDSACSDEDECTRGDVCLAGACGSRACEVGVQQVELPSGKPAIEVDCQLLGTDLPPDGTCKSAAFAVPTDAAGVASSRRPLGPSTSRVGERPPGERITRRKKARTASGRVVLKLRLTKRGRKVLADAPKGELQVVVNTKIRRGKILSIIQRLLRLRG